jgi:hypothetical protein
VRICLTVSFWADAATSQEREIPERCEMGIGRTFAGHAAVLRRFYNPEF